MSGRLRATKLRPSDESPAFRLEARRSAEFRDVLETAHGWTSSGGRKVCFRADDMG